MKTPTHEDLNEMDEDITFTPLQAIKAMKARIDGDWDNKQLLKLGPLLPDENEDIRRILNCTPLTQ